ncbi:cardiolipin synthase ClsB [Halomonas sp. MCCC 1A11036]|uniref:Cardiolipin synthase B n=1 Tax=Billgrantia zhangzhouensis TaxID=2733481 RepID=A0ABS9AH90_9GAMM|nr:cardiolipin synthase ClsB [Halomonas zhangzhouensis]MCE8021037.1 cardiolipin synthase ClsB [Halomonas zhangzhouensis]
MSQSPRASSQTVVASLRSCSPHCRDRLVKFQWKEGNDAELLINGSEYFPDVFEAIRSARREILIETFIIFDDEVGQALKEALLEAAARQVRIEVTVDGYGTADLGDEYVAELTEAGVHMHIYDPQPRRLGVRTNLFRRLHRKIVVVDGEVAYISGINFGWDHLPEAYAMGKQDYGIRVRGPIVEDIRRTARALLLEHQAVRGLPETLAETPSAGQAAMRMAIRDNRRHRTDIEDHYLQAIRTARSRLVIANAYFFPSYRIWRELRNAARRGVEVVLILQGRPDMPWARMFSSSLYSYLLKDGIHIYEYKERPLHAKIAVADDEWATVGSSNLDPLSLSLNLEANLFIRDATLNRKIHDHLMGLIENSCHMVTPEAAERGRWWRAPLMFVSYHFLRHFPVSVGWQPGHTPKLKPLTPTPQAQKQDNEQELH